MTSVPSECQHHRSTLSAVLDGAADPAEVAAVEAHLACCSGCAAYRRRLDDLAMLVARSPAPPASDLVPALAPVLDPDPTAGEAQGPSLARYLLAAVATAQIALSLPALVLGRGSSEVHTSRHLGAWAVAFGVGLLMAAARPRHARTLLPVAATLTVAVAVTLVVDLVGGNRTATPEASHLLEAVGLGLLALVHRRAGPDVPGLGYDPQMPLAAGGT